MALYPTLNNFRYTARNFSFGLNFLKEIEEEEENEVLNTLDIDWNEPVQCDEIPSDLINDTADIDWDDEIPSDLINDK